MKVLNLSLDKHIMDSTSAVAKRMVWFGDIVERYTIVIPFVKRKKEVLSEKVRVYGSGGTNKFLQFLFMYFVSRRILEHVFRTDDDYDVVTVQDPYFLGLLGLVLARQFGLGCEVQVHGWGNIGFLKKMVRTFVLKRATGVRVVSERMKKDVMSFGVKEQHISVIPVYTDNTLRDTQLTSDNVFTFLSVSRLVSVKNITMQLFALAKLHELGHSCRLVIVGEGIERHELETVAQGLVLDDDVTFAGWQQADKLAETYASVDCLLLTSMSEGWGMVVLEAGSYGVPTIMTDVGLAGEVVHHEQNGVVIPVGDEEALVAAMTRVMTDSDFCDTLSANIRETVKHLPSKSDILALYFKAWKKIV